MCFSSGSVAYSGHGYPDRVAVRRFSHTVTITEPFWLRLVGRLCVDLVSVTLTIA